jgi:S-adenosylmethionine decarboxylase proenzyme
MKRCLCFFFSFLLISSFTAANEDKYDFVGRHFLASYLDCSEEALNNTEKLQQAMIDAIEASGATLVDMTDFEFTPAGYTMIALLSESHASIHTYPDRRACFVDLFTCGTECSAEAFDDVLRQYLSPGRVNARILLRDENNRDDFSR